MNISQYIDLTLLNSSATLEELHRLSTLAEQHHVAAICVYPEHLMQIDPIQDVKRATVINFPTGNQAHDNNLETIDQSIKKFHANEIDYVFAYNTYLLGNKKQALEYCKEAYALSKQYGANFKVILETGMLPSPAIIHQMSIDIIEHGCDFLKTSTGKTPIGASLEAATAILSAIVDTQSETGIKLSGGIRTVEQALNFMNLAERALEKELDKSWFRLGTSQLLEK